MTKPQTQQATSQGAKKNAPQGAPKQPPQQPKQQNNKPQQQNGNKQQQKSGNGANVKSPQQQPTSAPSRQSKKQPQQQADSAPQKKKQQQPPQKKKLAPEDESDENEENEEGAVVGEGVVVDDGEDEEMGDEEEYSGEKLGFFARRISPGDNGELVSAGVHRVLRLSQVSLPHDAPKDARASLVVRVAQMRAEEDEEDDEGEENESELPIKEYTLCTLTSYRPDTTITAYFTAQEMGELAVIGNSPLDVTGSVTIIDEVDDEEMGEDGEYEDEDEEMDSEDEADENGAAAVHARDAKRASAKKRDGFFPSLMTELMGDDDDEDGDDEDEDEDDDDESDNDSALILDPETAEAQRQALKGRIELVESPKLAPKSSPKMKSKSPQSSPKLSAAEAPKSSPKMTPSTPAADPKSSPKMSAAEAPKSSPKMSPSTGQKRKLDDESSGADVPAAATQTPAKKAKNENAPATAATPATQKFPCDQCERSFAQEGALKQHVQTKHAAGGAKNSQTPSQSAKKEKK